MALELSNSTRRALRELNIEPNIAVKFEGYDVIFSARPVKEFITINCPGFFIGEPGFFIGGLKDIEAERNKTLIDSKTTSYTIRQQINHDEGKSSSISSMNVGLVDKDQFVTNLISPGQVLEDILGRKVQIFVTYGDVSFFEDSIEVFKGFVTSVDSGPGLIKFKINHPDTKKNVEILKSVETGLTSSINSIETTIFVDNADDLLVPSGLLGGYLRIGNEIMSYTTVVGTTVSGVVRGVEGTTAIAHSAGDTVTPIYSLEGNPFDIALQLMMSGHGTDPMHEDIAVSSFLQIGTSPTTVANAVYFDQVNLTQDFGLTIGDTVTITGATNGANNVVSATILDIVGADSGQYLVLSGVSLVLETTTSAVMSTFSQYNTLPSGMRMKPDDVDIAEHIKIRDLFHSSVQMRFFIKEDKINGKEFIEEQLFRPIACYALPRKAKSSVGFTVGPIPGEEIQSLDITNIKDPKNLRIVRTTARAFFNEVVYKYDDTPLEADVKFTRGKVLISQDSKNRIPGGDRTFTIDSLGLRTSLNGENIAASNSQRIIDRYKFGAETVYAKALLRDSVGIEVGDIVIGDFKDLQVSDILRGDRQFKARLFEVQNKSLNLKTGNVDFTLLNTGFGIDDRFGLMSPCSPIAGVISQSQFVIGPDPLYPSKFGADEFRKWETIVNLANPMSVKIRNEDFSICEDAVVTSITENTFTLASPAVTPLTSSLMVEFTGYEDTDTSDKQKLVYAYMTDNPTFLDGENAYSML